ncbi:MAG TPA: FliA/WhiG family RNA polymerase sigma factor [Nitrospirota bacterium]
MSREYAVERCNSESENERDARIASFYPQINYLAKRLAMRLPSNVMVEDLINAGTLGLMDALEKFDPEKGVQFSTYAEFRIKGAMLDELRNMDWFPRSMRKKATMIQKGLEKAQSKLGRNATEEDVSSEMGITLTEYRKMLDEVGSVSVVSIEDLALGREEERSVWETIADPSTVDPIETLGLEELRNSLASCIGTLPEKEKIVVTLYYYEELSMKEIGAVLSITESRVSQLHSQAVIRLKTKMRKFAQR